MQGERRGSVVLVVVALLALLAVMGTVYIISARSERVSANAMSEAVNLDMAQAAVHAQVRAAMSRSLYDATGILGGLRHTGSFGSQAARRWTMPELGLTNGIGVANDNTMIPDDTWLATNLYRDGYALDTRYNDFSYLTPYAFNPANGTYDPAMPNFDAFTGQPAVPTFKVVADDPTVTLDDGIVQMLPFSEASGLRYRFGVRIIDTNRMANLRVGTAQASTLGADAYGTYLGSYALGHPEIFDPRDQFYLDKYWPRVQSDLTDELELRAYGSLGTLLLPAVAAPGPMMPVWPYTLGNRSPYDAGVVGNYRRGYYTTNSYSRDLRPYILSTDQSPLTINAHSAFTLTEPNQLESAVIWPPFPRRAVANPVITQLSDYPAADSLAFSATNIATAMEKIAGYSHAEACTFAANYISFRWNSWLATTVNFRNQSIPAYYLNDGLSFIDDKGICFSTSRTRPAKPAPYAFGFAGTTDLHAEKGTVHLGFSAQPFINELAVRQTTAGTTGSDDDCAIEFYNPYSTALSLIGYRLRLREDRQIDLDSYFVPPRGYLVITRKWDELARVDGKDTVWAVNGNLNFRDCSTIYLMREFIPRGKHSLFYAAIDQYDCSSIANPPPETDRTSGDYFERRSNHDADPSDGDDLAHWCVASADPDLSAKLRHDTKLGKEHMTLGSANPTDGDQTQTIRLYDRFADYNAEQRSILYNVNEFNRIMRIGHVVDATTGLPVKQGLISAQLLAAIREPKKEVAQTQFPADAAVHFDFRAAPWIFSATGNTGPDDPPPPPPPHDNPYPPGDIRAQRLLDCITFVHGQTLRIAGQINVNTASAEVLRTIPILNENPNWVAAILAYRWRTTSLDPRIPPDYRSGLYDFSDSLTPGCKYPGYGIRSLAELEVPLSFPFSAANSIDQRDALWSDVYNLCTVRSDTFVVYGYLEGVKQNPRYSGPFDNSRIWYQTGNAVTDDINNRSAPLLRVARRRWVALIDRSQNSSSRVLLDGTGLDPGFTLPRILAIKDMPR